MMNNQWITQKPIAHRGLWSADTPENSLGACVSAADAGFPVEIDVQMMADGTLVVFHDWSLERMTQNTHMIEHLAYDQVAHLSLNGTSEHIPRLTDVLIKIDGRVPVLLEMKNKMHSRRSYVQQVYIQMKKYHGAYALSSFDPFLVKMAKRRLPQVLCGQNFSDYKDRNIFLSTAQTHLMYVLWQASLFMPDFFVCRASLLPRSYVVRIAQKAQLPLLTWGIKDHEEYDRIKHVISNEIFDRVPYHV